MKLQEVCSYVADKIDNSALNKDNYISTENMMQNCGGVTAASNVPVGKSTRFVEGDILFSNIRPYFKKLWRANISGGCSADVLCIRANEKIDSTYLYYLLTQDSFISYVMAGTKGCKMPRGDKQYNMAWNINLPFLDVQVKIAAQLSEIDDKIAINRRICENLEAQAQALFKHWFIDFAPFKNGKFVESELGMIPEGWRVGRLDELGDIVGGATPSKAEDSYYTSKGIAWLTPKDLSNKLSKFTSRGEIDLTQEGYNSCSAKLMPKGSVLFSSRAPIGYLTIAKNDICTNQGFKSVVPKYAGTAYIYYLLKTNTKRIESMSSGTTFKEASGSLMKSLAVIIPPKSIINYYEASVVEIFNEQEVIENESSLLSTLRDSLLPKLMSGQIKL